MLTFQISFVSFFNGFSATDSEETFLNRNVYGF